MRDTQQDMESSAASARKFHENQSNQEEALLRMRSGIRLTDSEWRKSARKSRLAPTIDMLRNAHGFTILGDGSDSNGYFLQDLRQRPCKVHVTDAIKEAYYETDHWRETRDERMQRDDMLCVLCGEFSQLQVHHVTYRNLFHEPLCDLMTVCETCHSRIHEAARLKFPSGIPTEFVQLLGFEPKFDQWLLPKGRVF